MSESLEGRIMYLVRHGETFANVGQYMQGLDDLLTPEGELQAEKLAERAMNIEFSKLVSSDAVRAQQTATILSKRTNHSLYTTPLLRELKGPTSLIGSLRASDEFQKYSDFCDEHLYKDIRFEDEENFNDFRERGIKALEHLESLPDEKILVVTHGLFLRVVIGTCLTQKNLTPEVWNMFYAGLRTQNTGLTVMRHENGSWHLFTWNDHAHLG